MSTYDREHYGLALPQPYLASWPEELPRNATNPAVASSLQAFEGQGRLVGFTVTNTNTTAQFVQLFDAVAAPATGAVPIMSPSVPGSGSLSLMFGPDGRWFSRGLVVCNSSTQASLTIGSADCIFDVQYVPQRQ